jgi:hypothetical protein
MGGLRVTDVNQAQRRAADLAMKVSGSQNILMARLQEFGALCAMGQYQQTDYVRQSAHVLLDLFLDASLDQARFNRELSGLK